MKAMVILHPAKLKIIINPEGKPENSAGSVYLPGLYQPWPEARGQGFAEINVVGDTLRALLVEISSRYERTGIGYDLISPDNNDVKLDFNVLVNDKNYFLIPDGIDNKLKDGDVVKITENIIGLC